MTQKKLYKIFNYYKKKYKLKVNFEIIKDYSNSIFYYRQNEKTGYILLSIKQLKYHSTAQKRFKTNCIKKILLYSLLHELKHAIDCFKNPDNFLTDVNNQLHLLHDKKPLEIQADNFALKHFKTWY